jgi:predicted phosphoribosyltransferase
MATSTAGFDMDDYLIGGRFEDRYQAGQLLARRLLHYQDDPNLLVLGLPRGGVPVAFEVAKALNAPLDVFVVRKLGIPAYPEMAMGAVASGGVRVLNPRVIAELRIPESLIERVSAEETAEVSRREREYRGGLPPPHIAGATVILVDDGLATGATMRAAAESIRLQKPRRLVIAVPTAASKTSREMRSEADEVICLIESNRFYSVGQWYRDFGQLSDEEVRELLRRSKAARGDQADQA